MAKDRRVNGRNTRKEVTKKQFFVRLSAIVTAFIVVATASVIGIVNMGSAPADSAVLTGTTTTINRGGDQVASSDVVTTLSAENATKTGAPATTTAAPTTTVTTTTVTTTVTTTTAPTKAPISTSSDLRLVNPWNPMTKEQIASQNLVHYSGNYYVDANMLSSLKAMLNAGSAYGLYVTSAYRSYDTQEGLYQNKVQRVINATGMSYENALVEAATVVARPGTSEHHTGLAVDLLHSQCWELEEYWDQYEAFDWMKAHCAEYGFILRYPKEKQSITGVIYEPWHYRYVGVEAATEIMSRGITLEEYLGQA